MYVVYFDQGLFHTVESVKLIVIQNEHSAHSGDEKSMFMLVYHYSNKNNLLRLPVHTQTLKYQLKSIKD